MAKPNDYCGLEETNTQHDNSKDTAPFAADSRVFPELKIFIKEKILTNRFSLLTLAVLILWIFVIILTIVCFSRLSNLNARSSSAEEATSSLQKSYENISVYIQAPLQVLRSSLQQLNKSIAMNSKIAQNHSAYIKYHVQQSSMVFDEVNQKIMVLDRNVNNFQKNYSSGGEIDPSLQTLATSILIQYGMARSSPALSCASILQLRPTSPSDYYWVQASNESSVQVYCVMTAPCDTVTGGGWERVFQAIFNVTVHVGFEEVRDLLSRNISLFLSTSQIIVRVWDDKKDDHAYPYHGDRNGTWSYLGAIGSRIDCYNDASSVVHHADVTCFCYLIELQHHESESMLVSIVVQLKITNYSHAEVYVR